MKKISNQTVFIIFTLILLLLIVFYSVNKETFSKLYDSSTKELSYNDYNRHESPKYIVSIFHLNSNNEHLPFTTAFLRKYFYPIDKKYYYELFINAPLSYGGDYIQHKTNDKLNINNSSYEVFMNTENNTEGLLVGNAVRQGNGYHVFTLDSQENYKTVTIKLEDFVLLSGNIH
jgi:hypothetical protein